MRNIAYIYVMKNVEPEYLDLVNQIDKILSASSDFKGAAEKIYQELKKSWGVKNFTVALLNPREKTISFQVFVDNGKIKKLGPKAQADGLIRYVTNQRKTVRINKDLSAFCKKSKIVLGPDLKAAKSWLGVPMICQSKVLGAIAIHEKSEAAYSELEGIILANIAWKLALMLDHARLSEELKSSSLMDPTTKIANRQYFNLVLEREMKKAVGYTRPLSLALVEIDDYANIKKNLGLDNADKLLAYIANFIKSNVRDTDFVAQFDDYYFVLLFPETDNPGAMIVAKRLRSRVEDDKIAIKDLRKMNITFSIGVATYPYHAENIEGLLKVAAKATKKAKELGSNRVETI